MTRSISLSTKALSLIASAILLSLVFLIFAGNIFAQTPSPASKKERRDAQKVKVCQIHEKTIEKRFSQLSEVVKRMVSKFNAISTRVQLRYTDKLVPQGKTIPNYNELLSDITAKKTAVDAALAAAESTSNNFSCGVASDPKAELTTYRKNMQAVKSALHDFRKSVRNLIVAVANASGEALKTPEAKNE